MLPSKLNCQSKHCRQQVFNLSIGMALTFLLTACGLFSAAGPAATPIPDAPSFTPVPTFTATPVMPPSPTAAPTNPPAATPAPATTTITPTVVLTTSVTVSDSIPATPAVEQIEPILIVSSDAVNIRSGPATSFEVIGAANVGQQFAITGKNEGGDWWQVCCLDGQDAGVRGWIFAELAQAQNTSSVAVVAAAPPAVDHAASAETPTAMPAAEAAGELDTPTPAPVAAANPFGEGSAGNLDPNAQYQIVHFKVLGLEENNGGIRDSSAQHHIFVTVLDAAGNGVDGAIVRNAVGEKLDVTTGGKGPGKAEITMYWEPFKLYVATDPAGPVTSQVSNQMGLAFPHLPDIVGRLGGIDYEYGVCPTLEIKCAWPIQAVHFSYEITFQKVK
jgi:uncharacterized protein YgiM (DUF1202 family)